MNTSQRSSTQLSIIAAMADNRVIGRDNQLPWRLPADLQHFKRLSMGKPIIMGRKTWESLPGILPGRPHLVVTRNLHYQADGVQVVHSLQQALQACAEVEECMLVGGADLYRQGLPYASRMYLTYVHCAPIGDAYFPEFDPAEWQEVERQPGECDESNKLAHTFVTLQRV